MPSPMKKTIILIFSILILTIITFASERAVGAIEKRISIGTIRRDAIDQVGPPWYREEWKYRLPISILSNSTVPIDYYQVLIELNSDNFDFSHANDDGSDIRFTNSTGTVPIPYWIESWDKPSQHAYIWVLVSNLYPDPYDTTIYLYYHNPTATSASSGIDTFIDLFNDDWCSFPGSGCAQNAESQQTQLSEDSQNIFDTTRSRNSLGIVNTTWVTITGAPSVSSGIVNLPTGTGIKSNNTYGPNKVIGYRANFGLGNGYEWGGFIDGNNLSRTIIGDLPSDIHGLYLINYSGDSSSKIGSTDFHNTFHIYEIRWKNGQSMADVDHGATNRINSIQVPSTSLPVTFYSYTGSGATLKVDWIYVRQYRDPEPTPNIDITKEQGLVDLDVNLSDTPDPLPKDHELSYPITVTNISSIEAPGVVVTDTLPAGVNFVRTNPAIGCTHPTGKVVCSLNTIAANSAGSVTIVVTPIIDNGIITNTVIVGSPGYELNLSNNTKQVNTLIDSTPPSVNWEYPVKNGMEFTTGGGFISLVASATDNDQVAWVEFWYWDHLPLNNPRGKVSIGFDNSYPYQIQFNSDELVANQEYQVFVQATDRAGNISSIYTPPFPRIFITRTAIFYAYLPAAIK
jgi:uncharacterized repeat protein (TIGR01451 family)